MRPFTTLIDAATLARQLTRDDLVLFDCRAELGNVHWGEAQFGEAHLPGAQFLHLDRDLSGPDHTDERPASVAGSACTRRKAW